MDSEVTCPSKAESAVFMLKTLLNFHERSYTIPIKLNGVEEKHIDPYGDALEEAIRCVKLVNGLD